MNTNHILMVSIIFLSVIILMCSCGGGIRVRENFLDEVVGYSGDDLEETNILDSSEQHVQEIMPTDSVQETQIDESKTTVSSPATQLPSVTEEVSEEKTEMPLKQNQVQPNTESMDSFKPLINVLGYSYCEYAKF